MNTATDNILSFPPSKAYFVYAELSGDEDFPIAIFWDRDAAEECAMAENEVTQASYVVCVEIIILKDDDGVRCKLSDLPTIAPWVATPGMCTK